MTQSNRFDPNNYTKHRPVNVYRDYHKLGKFGSSLLMIRWQTALNPKVSQSPLIGTIRARTITPLGELEPHDYQLKVTVGTKPFIQFLTPPTSEFEYELEIKNPVGIDKSSIEIWEYVDPLTYLNQNQPVGHSSAQSPSFDPTALVAATAANTAAIGTMVTAINAQPSLIADAIDNNQYDTSAVNPPPVVGIVAALVLSADTTRVKANFRNESISANHKIKIFASTVPLTIPQLAAINYSTLNSLDELLKGDSWESIDGESKSNFYAISATAGANLAITTTKTI
jgi:hypothetical protein